MIKLSLNKKKNKYIPVNTKKHKTEKLFQDNLMIRFPETAKTHSPNHICIGKPGAGMSFSEKNKYYQ